MAAFKKYNPRAEVVGSSDELADSYLIRDAIDEIRKWSAEKQKHPNEYANTVEHLYNVTLPITLDDAEFNKETEFFNNVINIKASYKPQSRSEHDAKKFFMENTLPIKSADYLFRAIMKSLSRQGKLGLKKVRITV